MITLKKLRNKKIGIIGMGYIGSNLFEYLKKYDKEYNLTIVKITEANFEKIIPDETFDYLINCAGTSGDYRTKILETVDSNVSLTVFLLKNMKVNEAFLSLSSTRVYGFSNKKKDIFSEDKCNYRNHIDLDYIYDGSKELMESLLMNYSKKSNCKLIVVRLSNLYGKFKKLDDATLIKKIVRYAKEKKAVKTEENKNSTKDYVYIGDAIDGILSALVFSKKSDIYNIASGKSYSLNDIEKILKLKIKYPNKVKNATYSNISIKKAKKKIGFNPKVSFDKGLKIVKGEINEYN